MPAASAPEHRRGGHRPLPASSEIRSRRGPSVQHGRRPPRPSPPSRPTTTPPAPPSKEPAVNSSQAAHPHTIPTADDAVEAPAGTTMARDDAGRQMTAMGHELPNHVAEQEEITAFGSPLTAAERAEHERAVTAWITRREAERKSRRAPEVGTRRFERIGTGADPRVAAMVYVGGGQWRREDSPEGIEAEPGGTAPSASGNEPPPWRTRTSRRPSASMTRTPGPGSSSRTRKRPRPTQATRAGVVLPSRAPWTPCSWPSSTRVTSSGWDSSDEPRSAGRAAVGQHGAGERPRCGAAVLSVVDQHSCRAPRCVMTLSSCVRRWGLGFSAISGCSAAASAVQRTASCELRLAEGRAPPRSRWRRA